MALMSYTVTLERALVMESKRSMVGDVEDGVEQGKGRECSTPPGEVELCYS